MSNSEILGLHRITKKHLKDLCKKHNLYQTPHLNDQLYLHFQGFQSIENLEEYTGLKCLWLESNAISEIQGLDSQSELKCLFLQNNLIKKIENLQCCTSLDTLNLSSNHITKIENCGIDILPVLSTLNISRNYLRNSDGINELVNCKQLWSLDLSHNRIDDILVVKIFAKMPELRVLVLQGNPVVSKVPQYRKTLILECKNLTYLDSRPVFPKDRACAEAWKRGGYEEERKEHDRWIRMDRKKIRDSVNATLRLRQKHGAGDCQLLESSDEENDKMEQHKLRQIPKDGTSSGDLEIIGVGKKVRMDSDSSSSTSSDDSSQEPEHKKDSGIDISALNTEQNVEEEDSSEELSTYNYTKEFEEQLKLEDGFNRDEICSEKMIDGNAPRLNEICKIEEKSLNEDCEDMKIDGREVDFKISGVISETGKIGSKQENAKTYYENFNLETEEVVDLRSEDQELLEKTTDLSVSTKTIEDTKETRLSEEFEIEEKCLSTKFEDIKIDGRETNFEISEVCSEHADIKIKEKEGKTHYAASKLGRGEDDDLRSEDQGHLQKPIENNEDNDSSFLSMSTSSDFSKQDGSTKSLSSSFSTTSSSESSVTKSSSSDIANYSYDLLKVVASVQSKTCSEFTEETIENKPSLLLNNISEEELEHSEVKAEEYKDQNALDKKLFITKPLTSDTLLDYEKNIKTHSANSILQIDMNCKSEDTELLQKSIESNKENYSSFLSLSTNSDFSEHSELTKTISSSSSSSSSSDSSFTSNSSSDSETYIGDDLLQNVSEIISVRSSVGTEITQEAIKKNARTDDIEKELHSSGGETDKKTVITEALTSDEVLQSSSKSTLADCIDGCKKLSSEESKKDESESSKIPNQKDLELSSLQKINSSFESPQVLTQKNNISEDDTEARLRKIFEKILADEDSDGSLDLTAVTLKDQTKTQQLSDSQSYSNWPSSEDSRDNILSANEFHEEQVVLERSNDSIWKDRYWNLEDTNASNWLDSFMVMEEKKEPSPPKRLIEEIDNYNSCLALFDSTEDTVASDWLEQFLDGEELQQHANEVIEEFENCFTLEGSSDLDTKIKENDCRSDILEDTTEIFERSKLLEEKSEETPSNLANDLKEDIKKVGSLNKQVNDGNKLSKENEEKIKIEQENEQISTEIESRQHFEAEANYENSLKVSVSRYDDEDHTTLFGKNKDNCKTNSEDVLLEFNSQSSSLWERTLAAAHQEIPKEAVKLNEDSFENINEESGTLKSTEEIDDQKEKVSALEDQTVASNYLESILEDIIGTEGEAPLRHGTVLSTETLKFTKQDAACQQNTFNILEEKIPMRKINLESEENSHFEDDNSSSSSESYLEDPSSISTLREIVTTFNEVVENISSRNRQKSQLLKELIDNPLTTTFAGQSGEEINRQVEELKHEKREQLLNYVDCVYAQREKYDDTLDVVNGRLMVVKRSTGALEELPPPPPPPSLSQGTGSTKYISCGVSTTPTSCNDDDDSDCDECGTALSEDNDNDDDDEEEDDIEQHASDTKIKSILHSSCDVNYCASESVSLSSACSSTSEIEKKEDNNHHHHLDDVVDDSQQRAPAAGKLHNEIDSEVLPRFSKWLEKEQAPSSSASGPADYKLSSKEMTDKGGEGVRTQTRSEFQVELNDSIQSFMDFGENESASLEDIALIFENSKAGE